MPTRKDVLEEITCNFSLRSLASIPTRAAVSATQEACAPRVTELLIRRILMSVDKLDPNSPPPKSLLEGRKLSPELEALAEEMRKIRSEQRPTTLGEKLAQVERNRQATRSAADENTSA